MLEPERKVAHAAAEKAKTTSNPPPPSNSDHPEHHNHMGHHVDMKEFMRDSAAINRSIEPYCVLWNQSWGFQL